MTIKDIARLANVSPGTVSKIINGKSDSIRPETCERVMAIVRQYHYSPSNYIRQLSKERTYKLALLLGSSFSKPALMNAMIDAAKQYNYYPILCASGGRQAEENKFLSFLSNEPIDALLWEPASDLSQAHAQAESLDVPYLLLGDVHAPPQMLINFRAYGRMAAEALAAREHCRIAFLYGDERTENAILFEGFRKHLLSRMISATEDDYLHYDPERVIDLVKAGYTAAVCVGHEIAISLQQRLTRLNYLVPQDFSLLAITSERHPGDRAYSQIVLPYREYSRFLIDHLISQIEHQEGNSAFTDDRVQEISPVTITTPRDYSPRHILVIGSIHMDINIRTALLPQLGQTIAAKTLQMIPGGKGLNQAVGIAKLGRSVYLIGRTGGDFDGVQIYDTLSKYHVHTEYVTQDEENTGRAIIHILNSGESAITIYNGANSNVSNTDISACSHLFRNAAFCLLSTEVPMEAILHAAKLARKNRVKIIMKPSVVSVLSDELLSMVDYFIPNEKEINLLCPDLTNHYEQCEYLLKKGVKRVILTLGERGCYLHAPDHTRLFPASEHAAADTTGGSDAFISALAVYLSENVELEQAIQAALYAAGFCVSRQGVVPALIDRESLDLYRSQEAAKSMNYTEATIQ